MNSLGRSPTSASLFPGKPDKQHDDIMRLFKARLARGTWKNKMHHTITYLRYINVKGADPLAPPAYTVMGLVAHLAANLKSPGAVNPGPST